jgi:hypothetical protein
LDKHVILSDTIRGDGQLINLDGIVAGLELGDGIFGGLGLQPQNRVLADVCRKIKAAANPRSPAQAQAENDALASAISSYNRPPSGPLSSGPALGPDAQEILELMEQEPDSEKRGIVEILREVEPGITRFFPRIQYAGTLNMGMKTRLFRQAVRELISAERIFPPEHNPSTNTRTYEYRVR